MDYFGIRAVNWTSLKRMSESPAHYMAGLVQPRRDTPALALGRLAHVLTFEPELLDEQFVVWDGSRRTKAYKDFVLEESLSPRPRDVIKQGELDQAMAIAAAARCNPTAAPYLEDGIFEQVLQWEDQATGLACKAKVDWLCPSRKALIDLKTARTTDPQRFARAAADLGYHGQLAHYAEGVEAVLGWRPEVVALLAVEKELPFDSVFFMLDRDSALYLGEEYRNRLMRELKACMATNTWPGRATGPVELELPGWAFNKEGV